MEQTDAAVLQALIERGVLPAASATGVEAQLDGGVTLEQALVEGDVIDGETLAQVRAEVLGMPYVDLREKQIARDVLNIIPESTARGHMIIAYEDTEAALLVAMANVRDRQIVEFIRKKVNKPVEVAVASAGAIRDVLGQYQQSLAVELDDVVSEELKSVSATTGEGGADELPVIRITQAILKHAIVEGASDIHIEPTETDVVVRYRIDGILHDMLKLPKVLQPGLVARIKVLASLKIDEHRLPQDGRFKLEADEYKVAFRVSILPVFDGEKVVMRLLDESGEAIGLDEIGLRPGPLKLLRRAIERPHGMLLVTGPTGSGKTTTLYAVMQELSTPEVNISTIEDPIEYRMPRVNQTQVKPTIGLTFANGLRSLVRQDPDIIMVGEIRDEETASLAVNAALTGHLVLSTLHTNSAAGALPRLRDMQVEAFLLASTLNMVAAQRLVRRLCEKCRTEQPLTEALLTDIGKEVSLKALQAVLAAEGLLREGQKLEDLSIFSPKGCRRCQDGYKGRTGIYELLPITPEIQALITPETTSAELEAAGRKHTGFVSMLEDGLVKVVQGITSVEEVLRVARE
ncbi:MAG: hypothetical protein COT71_02950 [Candidatus Andersenbacteria bacterium CG10_big_fil_rev_8_21_14_0_10_54_11]|uniref:Bacterial type II secretion system protein E domain-containing protein n=1 Tax=Candidatus Andersenbacteria bacterium CG10_big_fil_rev_8_21_14_0_10_54_11 TaxID=1974485 RepID=A0A2M6WZ33_9BACT|nr:MAG: hypothetical protein COT71_02950 [Candidatus Andersenbacteria bacterium CG10_big_fil_rev_8_21_14_0_10_54_11]